MTDVQSQLTVAVDLGGTNIRVAVVDAAGNIVRQIKKPVDQTPDKPTIVPDLINEVVAEDSLAKAVVGIPGIVDYELQQTVFYPNLPQKWIEYLTAAWIGSQTGLEVNLANDADLAAVGEAYYGGGRGFNDLVYVTISTGVGGAALLGGKLVHGKYAANDVGHIIVDLPAADKKQRYTPETYGSGLSLEKAAAAVGLDVTSEELLQLVRSGDKVASEVWESSILGAAAGIVNLAWLYAPQLIVIGGGVGLNKDLVHPIVNRLLESHGPSGVAKINIASAELGDNVGLVGAAGWWRAFN